MSRPSTQAGFTLIEVLVALAILAIALTALAGSTRTASHNATAMQERLFAQWIAEDRLNEYRLSGNWPTPGLHSGKRTLAGQQWRWRTHVEASSAKDILKATVSVSLANEPEQQLSSLQTHFTDYVRSRHIFSRQ